MFCLYQQSYVALQHHLQRACNAKAKSSPPPPAGAPPAALAVRTVAPEGCPVGPTGKSALSPAIPNSALVALYKPAQSRKASGSRARLMAAGADRAPEMVKGENAARPSANLQAQMRARAMLRQMVHGQQEPIGPQMPGNKVLQRQQRLLQAMDRDGLYRLLVGPKAYPEPLLPAPTLPPISAPMPMHRGVVRAVDLGTLTLEGLAPNQSVSVLFTDHGRRYFISPTLGRGRIKRFSVGTRATGEMVGVWQFAQHTSVPHVQVELSNLKRLCPGFDVFDVITSERYIYAMVTLMDGGDVLGALKHATTDTAPVIIHHIMAESARQLALMHAQGFVHGDVKPANMLCDSRGDVVLSDFDMARPVDARGTCSSHICGTYIAPEMWGREAVGRPIDTWAWAASFGDLILGETCNPHAFIASSKGKINAGASRLEARQFARWRQGLFDEEGAFDARRIVNDGTMWGRYYARLRRVEPVATTLVLAYGLEPNPARRIDMQTMAACCALLRRADRWDDAQGDRLLTKLLPAPHIKQWTDNLARLALDSRIG